VACRRQNLACACCLLEEQPEPGRQLSHPLDLQLKNWQGARRTYTCEQDHGNARQIVNSTL
jgi:hypothetical protein